MRMRARGSWHDMRQTHGGELTCVGPCRKRAQTPRLDILGWLRKLASWAWGATHQRAGQAFRTVYCYCYVLYVPRRVRRMHLCLVAEARDRM